MGNQVILVSRKQSAFARHSVLLGLTVSETRGAAPGEASWEAVQWEMSSMYDFVQRNSIISRLLKSPADCTRILDFNIAEADITDERIVNEALTYCDLLRIGSQQLPALCHFLGIATRSVFDSCFDLMAKFDIKTLILSHGNLGCHVFHGYAVSEKWGRLAFGNCTTEEAEGAFTAAYYAASRGEKKVFTDYHRQALAYLERICNAGG